MTYTVRNKANGAIWECTEEERQILLVSKMSKGKLTFVKKSSTPTPSEAKKAKSDTGK